MISPILRLSTDELMSAMDAINPVDVLVEGLLSGTSGTTDPDGTSDTGCAPEPGARLVPWHGGSPARTPGVELVLLDDQGAGSQCVLPASALRVLRTAALTALAAKELVVPGVVTAAVLGFDFAAQSSLRLIVRHLPGLSHVAICPTGDELARPTVSRVIDQLDLAGVGWSVSSAVADAVFGATLIVATISGQRWLEIRQLPKGALVVNTTGEDLPDGLVDAVDQIYVDDATLIDRNAHRYFARMHLTEANGGGAWDRARARGGARCVEADLTQVLTGAHAGRTHIDHVLLVELLGARALDVRLARQLHMAALEHGLGERIDG